MSVSPASAGSGRDNHSLLADLLEERQGGVAIGRETVALLKGAHRGANLVASRRPHSPTS